jgi:cell division protein FtsQ
MDRLLPALLGRPFAPAAMARRKRSVAALVWSRRRLRIALLAALCAPVLVVGGWMLLRGSSLSSVDQVRISGVHGREAAQIEAALRRAAHGMSTLQVKRGALLAAVSRFPVVRDLRVSPSFPHGLRIGVIERPPVAELLAAGTRTAVAADGVVLGPGLLGGSLPSVRLSGVAPLPGQRVAGAGTRAELSVLGAAPVTLLGWVQTVSSGSEGLTVTMRNGLEIYFGNKTRPRAKWQAAARVLADPSSAGASYVDVRLPERPVAGSSAPGGLSGASTQVGATDPSAAALAARLDEAVAGGSAEAAASTPAAAAASPSTTGESTAGEQSASESKTAESSSGESGGGEPAASEPASESAASRPESESGPSESGATAP